MPEDPQRIVDELADRIARPVLLEDDAQRVIAYSVQTGQLDEARRTTILRRQTTDELRARFRSAGIFAARGPLRIPPMAGVLARVCVPVRHRDRLLGFVWLIDDAPPVSEADLGATTRAAGALALALLRDSLATGLGARREVAAVARVLCGEPASAAPASRLLVEVGAFPPAEPVTVLVVRPEPAVERAALERGLLAARSRLASRPPLHLVRPDHGVLVCAGPPPSGAEVATAVGMPAVVGVGRARASLAAAAESYREALHAAEVAARVPGFGPAVAWPDLGVYRMLAGDRQGELHPGLEPLLADPAHRPLLETLETYLDQAGSAAATARVLRLHRTSLYYRLRRVEELARTDLRRGDERLALHLSLKLARLTGRYPPVE